jgi:hypothetical protein
MTRDQALEACVRAMLRRKNYSEDMWQVAAALLASAMGNTVMATGPRPRLRSSGNSAHC